MTCEYNETEAIVTGSWQKPSGSHDATRQNMDNPLSEDTFPAHSVNEPTQTQKHDAMDYTSSTNPGLSELTLNGGEYPAHGHNRDGKFPHPNRKVLPF